MHLRKCQWCKLSIHPPKHRFCSKDHARKWHAKYRVDVAPAVNRECPECEKQVPTYRARYCSKACAHTSRLRQWRAAQRIKNKSTIPPDAPKLTSEERVRLIWKLAKARGKNATVPS